MFASVLATILIVSLVYLISLAICIHTSSSVIIITDNSLSDIYATRSHQLAHSNGGGGER